MIILGIVLIVLGLLFPTLYFLLWIGVVLLVVGLVLAALAASGRGRWYY